MSMGNAFASREGRDPTALHAQSGMPAPIARCIATLRSTAPFTVPAQWRASASAPSTFPAAIARRASPDATAKRVRLSAWPRSPVGSTDDVVEMALAFATLATAGRDAIYAATGNTGRIARRSVTGEGRATHKDDACRAGASARLDGRVKIACRAPPTVSRGTMVKIARALAWRM
jgi:hypothetical protein